MRLKGARAELSTTQHIYMKLDKRSPCAFSSLCSNRYTDDTLSIIRASFTVLVHRTSQMCPGVNNSSLIVNLL